MILIPLLFAMLQPTELPESLPVIENLPVAEVIPPIRMSSEIDETGRVGFYGYDVGTPSTLIMKRVVRSGSVLTEQDWDPSLALGRWGVFYGPLGRIREGAPTLYVGFPPDSQIDWLEGGRFLYSPDGDEWIVYWTEEHGQGWFGVSRVCTAPGPYHSGTLFAATHQANTQIIWGMDLATARPILVRLPDGVVLYPSDVDYRWALPAVQKQKETFWVDSSTRTTFFQSGFVAEAYRQPEPVLGFEPATSGDRDTFLLGNGERCNPSRVELKAVLPDGRMLVTLSASYPDRPPVDRTKAFNFDENPGGPLVLVSRLDGPQPGDLIQGWQVVGMFDIHGSSLRGNWLGVTWWLPNRNTTPENVRQWHALVHLDLPTVDFPPMPAPVFAWPPYEYW